MSYTITISDSEGFGDIFYADTEDEAYDKALNEMFLLDDEEAVFVIEDEDSGESKTYTRDGEFLW